MQFKKIIFTFGIIFAGNTAHSLQAVRLTDKAVVVVSPEEYRRLELEEAVGDLIVWIGSKIGFYTKKGWNSEIGLNLRTLSSKSSLVLGIAANFIGLASLIGSEKLFKKLPYNENYSQSDYSKKTILLGALCILTSYILDVDKQEQPVNFMQ